MYGPWAHTSLERFICRCLHIADFLKNIYTTRPVKLKPDEVWSYLCETSLRARSPIRGAQPANPRNPKKDRPRSLMLRALRVPNANLFDFIFIFARSCAFKRPLPSTEGDFLCI
jgi:hypothetical protein